MTHSIDPHYWPTVLIAHTYTLTDRTYVYTDNDKGNSHKNDMANNMEWVGLA